MSQFSVAEAKNNLPRLVQRAEAGEVVGITRRGKLVAMLLSEGEYARLRGERASFMEFISVWRDEASGETAAFAEPDDFANLRDKRPGREVEWN
jgi:prevent-host-death family protein